MNNNNSLDKYSNDEILKYLKEVWRQVLQISNCAYLADLFLEQFNKRTLKKEIRNYPEINYEFKMLFNESKKRGLITKRTTYTDIDKKDVELPIELLISRISHIEANEILTIDNIDQDGYLGNGKFVELENPFSFETDEEILACYFRNEEKLGDDLFLGYHIKCSEIREEHRKIKDALVSLVGGDQLLLNSHEKIIIISDNNRTIMDDESLHKYFDKDRIKEKSIIKKP